MPTDKQRLDWLGRKLEESQKFRFLMCNRGYWALVPESEVDEWYSTPREAIDAAMRQEAKAKRKGRVGK